MLKKWKQIGGFAMAAFLFVAVQSQAAQEDRAAQGQKLYDDLCAICHTEKPAKRMGQPVDGLVAKMEKVKGLTPPPNDKVAEMQEALKPLSGQDMKDIAVYLNGLK